MNDDDKQPSVIRRVHWSGGGGRGEPQGGAKAWAVDAKARGPAPGPMLRHIRPNDKDHELSPAG